jgi:hypothetical protein
MPVGTQDALNAVIYAPYHRRMRESLRRLVTDELIASHNADPLGPPSDDLRRILTYFAALPIDGNLIIERDSERFWYVCRLIGSPPYRADRIAGPFTSQRDALAVIFMRRLVEVLDVSLEAHYV